MPTQENSSEGKVTEASFVMIKNDDPTLAQQCQDAMLAALNDCLANGVVAPEPQRRAMIEAYRKAKEAYYAPKG